MSTVSTNVMDQNRSFFCRLSLVSALSLCFSLSVVAQPKTNYYTASTLDGKNGRSLELALKAIVYPHNRISYDDLWEKYPDTDLGPVDSIPSSYTGNKTDLIYDMYAWMSQYPKFYSDNNHTQTGGFNREHAVANSWWGAKAGNAEAYSDLHHVTPADGAANNAKSNYPLGEYSAGMTLKWPIKTETYMAADTHDHNSGKPCYNNASHVWEVSNSSDFGGADYVFEPAEQYKGDFARMYLYVVCAYEGELTWQTNYMFTSDAQKQTTIKPWALNLLLKWHRQDPISDKERARNNAVEGVQGNRNPFIDYPELVEYIWGNKQDSGFNLSKAVSSYSSEYGKDDKKTATITFVLHAKLGKAFEGFRYTTNSDGTKTYSSSNPAVATVNETTGDITLKSAGRTTITFTTSETASFTAAQDSYMIEVSE